MYRSPLARLPQLRKIVLLVTFVLPFCPAVMPTAAAAVPFARLLPADTVVYLHLPNAAELRAEFWEASLGRMIDDPQFRPLVDETFAAAERAFEPVRERFGLTLPEWLTLPKGEVGFAIVPVDGAAPAAVLILEAADDDRSIALLLERGREAAVKAGLIEESESVGDVQLNIFRTAAGKSREVLYLRHDGKLVIGSNRDVIKRVLEFWNGSDAATLGDHTPFLNLERYVGTAERAPVHVFWYVDPINLVRHATFGNTGAQVGLAILPALGLDGVPGVGGSMAFNRGPFDLVGQAYVLLDVPRAGVVECIALRPTPTEPEPWVFNGLTSYTTVSWDVERTYHQARQLVDSFQGDGTFRARITEPLNKVNDLDIETDVLPHLTSRFSMIVANEEPFVPESRGHLFSIEFGSPEKAEELVRHMAERYKERWTAATAGGHTYYHFVFEEAPEPTEDSERRPRRRRGPIDPCFAAVGKQVLIADRRSLLEKAFAAADDLGQRLAAAADFQFVAAKAAKYAGDDGPGLFAFTRPAEDLRYLHGLAQNEQIREQLARGGERNEFLRDFEQALNNRPLPPFEVLERYFSAGGLIVVDEPTGIRYLSFVLKPE